MRKCIVQDCGKSQTNKENMPGVTFHRITNEKFLTHFPLTLPPLRPPLDPLHSPSPSSSRHRVSSFVVVIIYHHYVVIIII
ncbi:hypothetical protein NQ318_017718 [Aromia moschata]|uniref:Uncharacterized protein n=1 Tax=Aromia moschata TaxID=1265417 RepID=A0AAV8XPE7_9CUCU|nr:hypothetical protein NQ318_017718 [Aromia moschata]